jgi:hypothetical protein
MVGPSAQVGNADVDAIAGAEGAAAAGTQPFTSASRAAEAAPTS